MQAKTIKCFVLFVLIGNTSIAQYGDVYKKISIRPTFGLGKNLMSNAILISGRDYIETTNKSSVLGMISSSNGSEFFSFKLTNTIGLGIDYAIDKNSAFGVDIETTAHLWRFITPTSWNILGNNNWSFIKATRFSSFGVHAKRFWWSRNNYRFAQAGIRYTLDQKQNIRNVFDENYIRNGSGLTVAEVKTYNHPIVLNFEVGLSRQRMFLIPFEHELSLGLTLPLTYYTRARYTYFENNSAIGSNDVKLSQRAVWLNLSFPIAILKSRPTRKYVPIYTQPSPPPVYIPQKEEVKFKGKKINPGESIVLKNINFDQSSDALLTDGKIELNTIADFMDEYPSVVIEISGHTSDEGVRKDNIDLSERRAEACKKYLIKHGIKSDRIKTRGIGPDQPISTNKGLNRRVEFKIVKY